MPVPDPEVRRLDEVYAGYRDDPRVRERWSRENPGNRAMVAERRAAALALLRERFPAGPVRLLDVGCGSGSELAWLVGNGVRAEGVVGVDLLPRRVRDAREGHARLAFAAANAEALPFRDGAFDVVVLYTVLSSILDPAMERRVAAETSRVLKPGGAILWYDMRWPNPSNRSIRPVGMRRLRALFPGLGVRARRITLAPPLARRLGRATDRLYPVLSKVPALCSHTLAFLEKPKGAVP